MALVFQIVVALLVLIGLITIIMSIKNWHWAQMLLVLTIFFMSIAVLVLGMEVFRIHRNLRAGMPQKIQQIENVEQEIHALRNGTRDPDVITRVFAGEPFNGEVPYDAEAEGRMPGLGVWTARLQDQLLARGRVWRGVKAAGPVDPQTGRIPVTVPTPRPHGLQQDSLVYAFEQGAPNPAAPAQGAQFLGEFRVVESRDDGVTLEAVQKLDRRTGERLVRSAQNGKVTWSLYETMPLDRHDLFAGMDEAQLRKYVPPASLPEYLKHGKPPTPDDDEYHRAAYDEADQRVALDDPKKAEERFDRPLRDYAYLFAELLRERAVAIAENAGLTEDIARLTAANQNGQQLTAHRKQELTALGKDLKLMQRDRQTIEKLRDAVQAQVENAKQQVAQLIPRNAQLASQLIEQQLARLQAVPTGGALTGAQP